MIGRGALIAILFSIYVSSEEVKNFTEFQERIAHGNDVHKEGAYPYYLSLQVENHSSGYSHYCGGSLIGRRIMITAAHCLENKDVVWATRILPNYRNTPFIQSNDRTFEISSYLVHPNYNSINGLYYKHDIAVALLDKDDPRPNAILKLPTKSLTPGTEVKILGFGKTEFNADPERLRDATVFIRSDYECMKKMPVYSYYVGNNICVSNERGSTALPGDSGGPLVWEDPQNHEQYLIGVITSVNAGHSGLVSVFTHLEFINNAINQLAPNI